MPRNGQWFNAFTIFDPTHYYRATGLCYIHYRANGEMAADQLIAEHGVGHYDAGWNKIEAEWFMGANGIEKRENASRGFDAVATGDGAWLHFPNLRQLQPDVGLCFYAASNNPSGCVIEVRSGGATGTLLGRCEIPCTFGHGVLAYNTFTCRLDSVRGELYNLTEDPQEWHNLYDRPEQRDRREQMTRDLLLYLATAWARFPYGETRVELRA